MKIKREPIVPVEPNVIISMSNQEAKDLYMELFKHKGAFTGTLRKLLMMMNENGFDSITIRKSRDQ